jgi:hypothetical protein
MFRARCLEAIFATASKTCSERFWKGHWLDHGPACALHLSPCTAKVPRAAASSELSRQLTKRA